MSKYPEGVPIKSPDKAERDPRRITTQKDKLHMWPK
jgi:hypothetical protein